jgi:choline-sulfatase
MNENNAFDTYLNRRDFIKTTTIGSLALTVGTDYKAKDIFAKTSKNTVKPNILFINTDQHNCEAISGYGCADVKTPHMDRIAKSGVSFSKSYSTNPVCCPARSSWFSGRMTSETGVTSNSMPMNPDLPDIGQWLPRAGYKTFYTGKWHIPKRTVSKSFTYFGANPKNTAETGDVITTRSVEGFLRNYRDREPFFLSVGLLNPHDICSFVLSSSIYDGKMPFPDLHDSLPPLPPNFDITMKEPQVIVNRREKYWGDHGLESHMGQWEENLLKFYMWSYYRYIEKVDGLIGVILDALARSPFADNTIVMLTSDHGDGNLRHKMTFKSFLYDEAARVPFMMSWRGQLPENVIDNSHLVSGVDVMPTVCDYAGIGAPPKMAGYSLRSIAEGNSDPWRDFVVSHTGNGGHMIRTDRYKLIHYDNDRVKQLFDMKRDPWETVNLAQEPRYHRTVQDHMTMLQGFEGQLDTWNA